VITIKKLTDNTNITLKRKIGNIYNNKLDKNSDLAETGEVDWGEDEGEEIII